MNKIWSNRLEKSDVVNINEPNFELDSTGILVIPGPMSS